MNSRILTCVLLLLAQNIYAQKYPALTVGENQTKTLPAGINNFSKIDIHSNGTLIIEPHSSDWCILNCTGDVNIHGTIKYSDFKSGRESHTTVAPDGTKLEYTFKEDNQGGSGGNGGNSGSGKYTGAGGKGVHGSGDLGGGGGGGGRYNPADSIPKRATKGADATGSMGGKMKTAGTEGSGGNGAVRDSFGNGGLLYIYCGGNFNGSSGSISAKGKEGANGASGANQTMKKGEDGPGAGGGGGGAPGGEGGVIKIKLVGTGDLFPALMVNGGAGGKGGSGGVGSFGDASNGKPGENGKPGANGQVSVMH